MKKNQNDAAVLEQSSDVAVVEQENFPQVQVPISSELSVETYQATQEMLKQIQDGKFKHEIEVTSEYKEFAEGEEFKGIYAGLVSISSKYAESNRAKDGKIDAVRIMGIDNKFYITAAAVIVGTLSEYKAPCPVVILCTGTDKSKNGEYQTFKISILK